MVAQSNANRINCVKAKIKKRQQNRKCRLYGDEDEAITYIISECYKLAQTEYKAKRDWFGKAIHWKLCKKFKFAYTNQWYMYNPEFVRETKTHNILWDFEIQTDHPISARRSDLVIVNKKKKKKKEKEPAEYLTLPFRLTTGYT